MELLSPVSNEIEHEMIGIGKMSGVGTTTIVIITINGGGLRFKVKAWQSEASDIVYLSNPLTDVFSFVLVSKLFEVWSI